MHRVYLIVWCLVGLPAAAVAQNSAPRFEYFVGYSFAHVPYLGQPSANLNGFEASLTINVNRWFGFVADFGTADGSRIIKFPAGIYNGIPSPQGFADTNQRFYQFGPQFAMRKSESITPYAHCLVGASLLSATWIYNGFGNSLDGTLISFSPKPFTMAFGSGLDIELNKYLAFRAIQADYIRTFRSGTDDNGFRLSTGLTVHSLRRH